jgi:pimeloyl-ACP methyl ester carboxylesterase
MGLATIERAAELGFLPVGFDVADQRPDGRPASEAGSDRLRRRHRPSAVKNAVHEIERTVGSIALAVRAAGVLTEKPFASVDEELWNKTLEVHPRGQRAARGRLPDTLPALGLDSVSGDVSIVQATLDSIPGDKILVGHSYGGFVITNAAIERSDVRGLVYTAAYVPDTGETINSLSDGYTPGAFLAHLVLAPSFPFVIVDPQFFPEDFAQDLNPKLAAQIAADQRPSSLFIFGTPSGSGAWHALPSWYAVSGADRAIDPDLQRFMAGRAGSTTVQFDDASHVGGLTHYATRFVKLIEQAVRATAS